MVQDADSGDAVALQTILAAPVRVFAVQIDNTNNDTENCWLKMWTSGTAVVGTDTPTAILMADAASKLQYTFDTGFVMSKLYAAVLTTNGTAGNAAPEGAVTIRFMVED
tara:strand:- start:2096 stop:2422 length:327 start_codon:yes stop_codon:yes gene_type:complete